MSEAGDASTTQPAAGTADSATDSSNAGEQEEQHKNLGLPVVVLLMAGGMAGSGVLVLPKAFADMGWIGAVILVVVCCVACYMGLLYGRCWNILEKFQDYKGHVRDPLLAVTEGAFGVPWRRFISVLFDVALLFIATLLLLLAAQNTQSLLYNATYNLPYRAWIAIITALLIPFMFLSTPKDFWPAGVLAIATTAIVSLMIIIELAVVGCHPEPRRTSTVQITWTGFCSGLSVIVVSLGGTCGFLTIHQDMKNRNDYAKANVITFIVLLVMYLSVGVSGYFICGPSVKDNILRSLPKDALRLTAEVLSTSHMAFAYILWMNPVSQHVEDLLKLPHECSWKRCVLRTCLALITCFLALVIPDFITIMNILAALFLFPLGFLLPSFCYLRLTKREETITDTKLPLHVSVLIWEIIIVSVIAMVWTTYSGLTGILQSYFSLTTVVD